MKVIQITDIHLVPAGKLLFGEDPVTRVRHCIAHVHEHHPDADLCVITGDLTLKLRAERLNKGTGRIYTITIVCTDAAGNEATKTVTVSVPR